MPRVSQSNYLTLHILRPSSPTAEAADLKSVKCEFDSHLGHQLIPMKSKDLKSLLDLINKHTKDWGEAPRLDFLINGELISFDKVEFSGFTSNNKVEINLVLEDKEEMEFIKNDVLS